jgi:hypothetical protein
MKDEALRLALEALETLHDENMDYLTRNKLGGENNQCMVFAREAITAIKAALEAKDGECKYCTDGCPACDARKLPEQEPVQVSPLEFVEMVMEKEHLVGKPIFWAEWPNKEKNT